MNTENPNLNYYLNKPVQELINPENYLIEDGAKERHRLYSLLLMSITKHYWNGLKKGRNGKYPLNPINYGKYEFNDYLGHNIASIAVDAYGEIIDFEFNHNSIFNSSTEHAEARMVKRVSILTQINDSWKVSLLSTKSKEDKNTFEDVTLYTTLESCSQCAGVMALAQVKEIVYLQTDPGMYLIGNILRNLTRKDENSIPTSKYNLTSPMPISGNDIDFLYFDKLNTDYKNFKLKLKDFNFYEPTNPQGNDQNNNSPSITSYLCTKTAFDIYNEAFKEFELLQTNILSFPNYKPKDKDGKEIEFARTNEYVLAEIKDFFQYATKSGRRGTPHK